MAAVHRSTVEAHEQAYLPVARCEDYARCLYVHVLYHCVGAQPCEQAYAVSCRIAMRIIGDIHSRYGVAVTIECTPECAVDLIGTDWFPLSAVGIAAPELPAACVVKHDVRAELHGLAHEVHLVYHSLHTLHGA